MVAHARADAPNECCGIVASEGGRAVKLTRVTNAAASPLRFEIGPAELYAVTSEIDEQGWELGAVYHSHTRSAAYPSQTDINFAAAWPGVVWVIVSLERPDGPDVQAFLIEDGEIQEAALEVD